METGGDFDTLEEAVEFFVLECWESRKRNGYPPTHVICSQSNGENIAAIVGIHDNAPAAVVICEQRGEKFTAVNWGCRKGVIHCDCMEPSDQVTYCWLIPATLFSPPVVTVRFREGTYCATVQGNHAYFVLWDALNRPIIGPWREGEFVVLLNNQVVWDAALQPRWLEHVLAKPADCARAHQRYFWNCIVTEDHDSEAKEECDALLWSADVLFNCKNAEEKLEIVRTFVDAVPDGKENERYLGFLGAGPLEELMGDWLLDELSKDEIDIRMAIALRSVRMEFESKSLQRRVQTLFVREH
ncbi:MAG: hypothetical protein K2W95_13630 [Candidatus Obscuribacterales bacterium]|nr:hypothetical protein [Candidatus Obscuribacterales bacterium]